MTDITPLQALRRLVDIARLIDADECPEFYNQLQGELTVAGAVLATQTDDFAHFLSYSGLSAESEEVKEKLKRAFEAGQPVEAAPPVLDGWKLVPIEPTGNMYRAAAKIDNEMFAGGSSHGADDEQIWNAMVDAAPLPEAGSVAPWESFEVEKTGDEHFDASNFLLKAAHEWWEASKRANVHGAVKWLDSEEGALLIYSRGEYKDALMQNIHKLSQEPISFVSTAPSGEVGRDAYPVWISVDDRMPDDNQKVIVLYWPFDNHENAQVAGEAEHIQGVFYTDEGDDHHYPSHWSPMPILLDAAITETKE